MRKALSLYSIVQKCDLGLLISAYFVLGIALVPTGTFLPEMNNIQNVYFKECHKQCRVENGKQICYTGCSSSGTSTEPAKKHVIHGSTGPTKPVPPKTGGAQNR